ncbi:hypothetical protein [Frankia sp. AgB32]|uniref:hypothetical protein n=1 Tax=Frankia sp. AgB32 TaxID=631119 RepID=UPI00200DE685|nr:hypothetical protein [Frankia sp. AgB32]MCK9895161.1 hypothetical protein [Frankia sp. AgB32]
MSQRPSGSVLAADPLARVAELPGIREAADTARAAVDTLLRHRILRRQSAEVTTEASLRAARACAALEGEDVALEFLRRHLTDSDDQAAGELSPVMLGTVRLYGELGVLAPAWERAPRQALARMHVLLGRGVLPDDVLGRPRADAGFGEATDPLRLGPPPTSVETSIRLDGLTGLLVAPTIAPAIVVAAVVHGELLALRPFGALDGVIARAASRLVLISRGLDPKALTATDVGHLEAGQDQPAGSGPADGTAAAGAEPSPADAVLPYREAADAYVHGGAEGVAAWVRHCARAMELAARESLAVCEALGRA